MKLIQTQSGRFYSVIISAAFVSLTIIGMGSFSYYLDDYSNSFAEMFRLQNLNLIETSDALQLGARLEATKKSGVVSCILAKSDGHMFYQLGSGQCESSLFSRAVAVTASGRNDFKIEFGIKLPWKVQIAFVGFLILNLLVFVVAYLWIISHERIKLQAQERLSLLAKQVAHDIRSPLSALNMVSSALNEISEEKRLLIRSAIQRINDIANDLLAKGKKVEEPKTKSKVRLPESKKVQTTKSLILLPALVDSLVSEKRIQYRDQIGVSIESDFKNSFGSFVVADGKELSRMLSNLINNAVEALPLGRGAIVVSVRQSTDTIQLCIQDNGVGIPPEVLKSLGEVGVTYGKEGTQSGSGLGLYHAKKTIEGSGGQLSVRSSLGSGTLIEIRLPRVPAPEWFLDKLTLRANSRIFCLDDDVSIHQIWKGRLEALNLSAQANIQMQNFTSALEFKKVAEQLPRSGDGQDIFLVDFELLGQKTNGIEVIKTLGTQKNVVLVTSHYDEVDIKDKCKLLGIKLLPKSLVGYVPLDVDKKHYGRQ